MLTPKQEKFCQCIVSGMSAKDSYIAAYDTKASDQTIRTEASKLMLREDIQDRIEDLTKPIQKAVQATALTEREKKRSFLWNMINNPATSDSDKLRAMDILNKMDSEYININKTIEDKPDISNLDTSTLIKLVKTG